jgi:hypothetical protein
VSHETPPAAGASLKARSPAQDRDSLAADHDAIGFDSDADVLRFERGSRKRPDAVGPSTTGRDLSRRTRGAGRVMTATVPRLERVRSIWASRHFSGRVKR